MANNVDQELKDIFGNLSAFFEDMTAYVFRFLQYLHDNFSKYGIGYDSGYKAPTTTTEAE